MRQMMFSGHSCSSAEWLAMRSILFGTKRCKLPGETETVYVLPEDFVTPFYCEACDRDFKSLVLRTKCPLCGAAPGEQAMTITHKDYTDRTFPFFVPVPE